MNPHADYVSFSIEASISIPQHSHNKYVQPGTEKVFKNIDFDLLQSIPAGKYQKISHFDPKASISINVKVSQTKDQRLSAVFPQFSKCKIPVRFQSFLFSSPLAWIIPAKSKKSCSSVKGFPVFVRYSHWFFVFAFSWRIKAVGQKRVEYELFKFFFSFKKLTPKYFISPCVYAA